jgi:alpha-L-rhamnosidase
VLWACAGTSSTSRPTARSATSGSGDWLDPAAPPDSPTASATDPILVATAYRVRTAQVLSGIAGILGQEADSAKYAELADSVRQAFHDEYVTPNGRVASDSQTGYALALEFSLLPDENQRARAAERLVEAVRTRAHKIATGFLGTPLICDALTSAGAIDDAYQLLRQKDCPSWLYPVTMGATTIWERWDSMLPDGSINPGEMTSFNHYALGAVADWMHGVLGGLAPGAPGYRVINVAPQPGGGITWAKTAHLTPRGRAEVSWRRDGQKLTVDVVVPPGTTAVSCCPARRPPRLVQEDTDSKAPVAFPPTTPSGVRRSPPKISGSRASLREERLILPSAAQSRQHVMSDRAVMAASRAGDGGVRVRAV